MQVCIHRGSKQIGGSCVEVESHSQRLIIDLGLPLDAEKK
jgi:ribonuclease J